MRVCVCRVCVCACVRVCVYSRSFWYAVAPTHQSYAITNVSYLFRFHTLDSSRAASAVSRLGSAFGPRSRRAFDTEKFQRASGLVRVNETTLLITYGISGCVVAYRYVCLDDVARMLARTLVVAVW